MFRYQILIEYVGTNFRGWQVQKKGKTIQGIIQDKISKLLKEEGYISDVKVSGDGSDKKIEIDLKYSENGSPVLAGLNRLSKPGRRLYVGSDSLPRNNGGLGTVVVSTSRGLLPDSEARKRKLGGELICEVWSWVGLATNQLKYLKK